MTNMQAIEKRVSRRTYLGQELQDNEYLKLSEILEQYNKEADMTSFILKDGSQAFDSVKKSYGMFKNVKSLIVLKGKKSDENLKEKTGYYGQKLIIEATKMNLGTCWIGGTCDMNSPILKIEDDELCHCVVTIGAVEQEQTFKEKAMIKVIHRKEKPLSYFYKADISEKVLPEYFMIGCKAVSKSPTALNSQKVSLKFEKDHTSISVPDTYKFDLVDLAIAKANFELATGLKFDYGNPSTLKLEK